MKERVPDHFNIFPSIFFDGIKKKNRFTFIPYDRICVATALFHCANGRKNWLFTRVFEINFFQCLMFTWKLL